MAAPFALADEKSYIDLVGGLFGSVESPRVIRDFCATHSPGNAAENAKLYDDWRLQHIELLDAVAAQVARADALLKNHKPPSDVESFDQIRINMRNRLEEEMKQKSPDWIVQFCSAYPRLIEAKHEAANTSIPQRLSIIEAAGKELVSREQT
jgi:hypothetical protein